MGTKLFANKSVVAFLAGAVFALGLGLSRMTQPAKIQAFLDIAGNWDPSLIFVMAGAVGTSFVLFRLAGRAPRPLLAESYMAPARTGIDRRLIGGAAIFGLGWGLSGFCPGPAITAVVSLHPGVLLFVGGMAAGMLAFERIPLARLLTGGQAAGSGVAAQVPAAGTGQGCG
jgi:uncharacterized membrane protein YedE/YeeE